MENLLEECNDLSGYSFCIEVLKIVTSRTKVSYYFQKDN